MKKTSIIFILSSLLALTLLNACGTKGLLYLPPEGAPSDAPPPHTEVMPGDKQK